MVAGSPPMTLPATLGSKYLEHRLSSWHSTPGGAKEEGERREGGGVSAAVTIKTRKDK